MEAGIKFLKDPKLTNRVRELSLLSSWKVIATILFLWATVAVTIFLALQINQVWFYILAIIIIGTRQHAIGIILHEGAHYRLFSKRWLNDLVSDIFSAYPLFLSTPSYRSTHFLHHTFNATDKDPDLLGSRADKNFDWPKPKKEGIKLLFLDFIGAHASLVFGVIVSWGILPRIFRLTPEKMSKIGKIPLDFSKSMFGRTPAQMRIPPAEWARFIAFYSIALFLLTHFGAWKAFGLLWMIPQLTVLVLIFRIRGASEHRGLEATHTLNETRTIANPPWWEKFLFAPLNVHFHIEHHLFPSVPFYHLPALHRALNESEEYRRLAHQTLTYLGKEKSLASELLI